MLDVAIQKSDNRFSKTLPVRVGKKPFEGNADNPDSIPASDSSPDVSALTPGGTGLPEIGGSFLHFELVSELGRGAFARVFLARQEALANRFVALKISLICSDEPQKLARLHHLNIVPVYSVHQVGLLQGICMPFLGRRTLGDVVATLEAKKSPRLLADELELRLDKAAPAQRENFDRGVLKIGLQLAEGLAHAHSEGIFHRDLKPANVLITDAGVPMILDFNVASCWSDAVKDHLVGGTLPYMSPEHLRAFMGSEGEEVDARSDLYSLGVLLYELITGQLPHLSRLEDRNLTPAELHEARRKQPTPPSGLTPNIAPGVDSIVLKLLKTHPLERYSNAEELVEDLRRELDNLPLKHAEEKSPFERMRKWRLRHPGWTSGGIATILAVLFLILPASIAALDYRRVAARTEQIQLAERERNELRTIEDLHNAVALLASSRDGAAREEGTRLTQSAFQRIGYSGGSVHTLEGVQDARRADELFELIFESQLLMSGETGLKGDPSWTRYMADPYFKGLELAAGNRYSEALIQLKKACWDRSDRFRAWFARGICHDRLEEREEAVAAFTAAAALKPDLPYAWLNRGLSLLKAKKYAEAEADFSKCLELKDDLWSALLNRGLCREARGRFRDAESDYSAAREFPDAPTRIYFLRSRVRKSLGNIDGAESDRLAGLAKEPNDSVSFETRGRWLMAVREWNKALNDFDSAIALRADSVDARLNKASIYADQLNKPAEAVLELDRLIERHPNHVEAIGGRGVYLARLGKAESARAAAQSLLKLDRSPFRLYQMAGLYALLSKNGGDERDKREAIRLLAQALQGGFRDWKMMDGDADIEAIRNEPKCVELVKAAKSLEELLRSQTR